MDNVCSSSFLCYVCGKLPPVVKGKHEVGLCLLVPIRAPADYRYVGIESRARSSCCNKPNTILVLEKSSHCVCIIYLQWLMIYRKMSAGSKESFENKKCSKLMPLTMKGRTGWALIGNQLAVQIRILTPSPMNNPMVFVMISMGRDSIQCGAHEPEHIH